ncbi:MAG: ATP-dependent 6-phosphofructokinase [Planctomycetota bacterium]
MSKRIAVTTGGGDAPGLNAVIRAVTLAAIKRGWEVIGIRCGYDGIMHSDEFSDGGMITLDRDMVRGIAHTGGTILGTTNRGNPFSYEETSSEGEVKKIDLSDRLVDGFKKNKLDALVAIGGDGSMRIAAKTAKLGIPVVGVPKTIDNDLDGTIATFGFDTAVDFATDAIGRLHSTAASHQRVMVVEVMGRDAGWIALHSGVAGSADAILLPEIPFDIKKVAEKIQERNSNQRPFSIVVVAEGASPVGGEASYVETEGVKKLGGMGEFVAEQLRGLVTNPVRCVVLGHLLRGGAPTARDRLLSLRFGAAAIRALDEGQNGVMVALDPPTVRYIPLEVCTQRIKTVPIDCDTILTARDLGTCFGD